VRARTCVVSDGGADPLGAPVAVHVDLEDDGDHGQQRRLLPLLLVLRRRLVVALLRRLRPLRFFFWNQVKLNQTRVNKDAREGKGLTTTGAPGKTAGDLLIGSGMTLAMAAAARRNGGLWIKQARWALAAAAAGERERV
jgi:hypothetical protein